MQVVDDKFLKPLNLELSKGVEFSLSTGEVVKLIEVSPIGEKPYLISTSELSNSVRDAIKTYCKLEVKTIQ
jgi:hypothetical protein